MVNGSEHRSVDKDFATEVDKSEKMIFRLNCSQKMMGAFWPYFWAYNAAVSTYASVSPWIGRIEGLDYIYVSRKVPSGLLAPEWLLNELKVIYCLFPHEQKRWERV